MSLPGTGNIMQEGGTFITLLRVPQCKTCLQCAAAPKKDKGRWKVMETTNCPSCCKGGQVLTEDEVGEAFRNNTHKVTFQNLLRKLNFVQYIVCILKNGHFIHLVNIFKM